MSNTQTLAMTGRQARRWEPKRMRLRLFSVAGRLAVSGRRVVLHLSRTGTWTSLLVAMLARLRAFPSPAANRLAHRPDHPTARPRGTGAQPSDLRRPGHTRQALSPDIGPDTGTVKPHQPTHERTGLVSEQQTRCGGTNADPVRALLPVHPHSE
jgi:Transposase DDE domain group 1